MSHRRLLAAITLLLALHGSPADAVKQNAERCAGAKDAATTQFAAARLACLRTALIHNTPVAASCVGAASAKFLAKLEKIERKGSCRPGGDAPTLTALLDTFATGLEGALGEPPTQGALRVSWILKTGGTSTTTCAGLPDQAGMSIVLTPTGSSDTITRMAPCEPGQADLADIPFGTYSIVVAIVNAQMQALGGSAPTLVAFTADGCTAFISGDCGRTLGVDVDIFP